jgi:hypothetical protein
MKKDLLAVAISLFAFTFGATAAEDTDSEAFASALRTAITEKDDQKLEALIYHEGASPEDKLRMTAMLQRLYFNGKEVNAISFEPLPTDFESVLIVQGRKIEPTSPPKGMVNVTFKGAVNGQGNSSGAYAVVDGKFYLVGMKSIDLGWKGPPDKNIGFSVVGQGASELQIHGVWNASGVQLKKEFKTSGITFWGQHFEELNVKSVNDDCDVTISITEDGKEIYSEPLKGKGSVQYKKKS